MAALDGILVNNSVGDKIGSTSVSSFSSDINDPNKDKDDVPDSEDGNPMYNIEYWTYSLGGGEYNIDPKKTIFDGYITVHDDSAKTTYYGGNQSWFDEFASTGCGVIASHDGVSYINNGLDYKYEKPDYLTEVSDYYLQLSANCQLAVVTMNEFGMAYSWGPVPPYNICNIINSGVDCEYTSLLLADTEDFRENVYIIIANSLQNDKPVVLFGTGMKLGVMNPSSDSEDWFTFSPPLGAFKWHFVTITGMIIVQGDLYLKVQTWGDVRYLRYDDIFGGINTIYYAE